MHAAFNLKELKLNRKLQKHTNGAVHWLLFCRAACSLQAMHHLELSVCTFLNKYHLSFSVATSQRLFVVHTTGMYCLK